MSLARSSQLGQCETSRKFQFFEKEQNRNFGKKIQNFSKSRMTKQISPLESSHEIWLPRRISSNSETVGIYTFFEETSVV